MYKIYLFFFVLFLLFVRSGYSQTFRIEGRVVNTKDQPIEFMDAYLVNTTDSDLPHVYTDSLGGFILNALGGDYTLQLAAFGKEKYRKNISLTQDLHLGKITIEEAVLLDSITITAKKKVIERKVDRLVFNVENSIVASGGDALDALKATPSVRVKNDKIAMLGKSGLKVMIDDRMVELSEESLINYLRTFSANDIKSIEVITTPPSKYAAAGNSGLINIQLKKSKKDSWSTTIGSTYNQNTYAGGTVQSSFNYNKDRLTFQASLNTGNLSKLMVDRSSFSYPLELWSKKAPRKIDNEYLSARLGLDYTISRTWGVGIQYMGTYDNIVIQQDALTTIQDNKSQDNIGEIYSNADWKIKPTINSINWRTQFSPDSLGKKLLIDLDYFTYESKEYRNYTGNEEYTNISIKKNKRFSGYNSNDTSIINYSLKLDAELPTPWGILSFGGKIYRTSTENTIEFLNKDMEDVKSDTKQKDSFEFIENNQALYLSGNLKINENCEIQTGLRMEATQTIGKSKGNSIENKNDYVKFFPTFYMTYNLKENHAFAINYSRRIDRPNYEQLNPFRIFSDPYSYGEGNPFLKPAYINTIEFSYVYKENWIQTIYMTQLNDGFGQLKIIDATSSKEHYIPWNYFDLLSFGVSETYSFAKWNWWTSLIVVDVNYNRAKSLVDTTEKEKKGFNTTISSTNDLILNKANTMLLNINYWVTLPGISDLYHVSSSSSLNLGFKLLLLDKNMTISAYVNDIFSGERVLATGYFNQVKTTNRNYEDSRSFRFSLNYKFGNSKLKTIPRKFGNDEEQQRI